MARDIYADVYKAFADDPKLHLRTDLGVHYRGGTLNLRKPPADAPNQRAAWQAGRDYAADKDALASASARTVEQSAPQPENGDAK